MPGQRPWRFWHHAQSPHLVNGRHLALHALCHPPRLRPQTSCLRGDACVLQVCTEKECLRTEQYHRLRLAAGLARRPGAGAPEPRSEIAGSVGAAPA